MCSYSLVCTLYAVCMHPQLHTFLASQPYGHAYSHLCMHCMQSFSELCFCIACIGAFLMHTTHTTSDRPSERRSRRIAYTPAEACDGHGWDDGGRSVRRAMKARKILLPAITGSERLFMIHRGMPEDASSRRRRNRQYKEEVEGRILSFPLFICLYAFCMQSVCILNCIHFRPLSPTDTPIRVSVCIVCSLFRSCVPT